MTDFTDIYHFLALTETLLTSGQPTEPQFRMLAENGVQSVINLALPTSSNALANEEQIVRELGMDYIPIPVEWENPTPENLEQFFEAMDKQGGKKTLVHCAANMRVSAFVALYRIKRLGWDREKAFQETYRIWDPFDHPAWKSLILFELRE